MISQQNYMIDKCINDFIVQSVLKVGTPISSFTAGAQNEDSRYELTLRQDLKRLFTQSRFW